MPDDKEMRPDVRFGLIALVVFLVCFYGPLAIGLLTGAIAWPY